MSFAQRRACLDANSASSSSSPAAPSGRGGRNQAGAPPAQPSPLVTPLTAWPSSVRAAAQLSGGAADAPVAASGA
eukprot:354212-Chlamydomonas_euryale.AAC.25